MESPSFIPLSRSKQSANSKANNDRYQQVTIVSEAADGARVYEFETDIDLRDDLPPGGRLEVAEQSGQARCRSGNTLFDSLYALAIEEARLNAVSSIEDADYAHGQPIETSVYKTGEKWNYVWTRDLAYALHLGLAPLNTDRALRSLKFKISALKESVRDGFSRQIVQDTGSGGSYPVSTDRVVWALGADEVMKHLTSSQRADFVAEVYPYLRDTIEQDRVLVFDAVTGLYRGEQSFLDWREQTYPQWTENDTLAIAMSKALSVNALNVFLLELAANFADSLGHTAESERYGSWAKDLRKAIQHHFYDAEAGLFRTYLLSEFGDVDLSLPRYDLLGNCLAILFDIATEEQARDILNRYPTGLHGPPVVWPQERQTPIYHNQGIWPFVTAYWIKAAVKVEHAPVVDAGLQSLMKLSAANLSNMENFDFVSGQAFIKTDTQEGPTINSRRQLWSVAGYISLVQNVLFGLHAMDFGMRVEPFVTRWMRVNLFADVKCLRLLNFSFLNATHSVTLHLPEIDCFLSETATVKRVLLNGDEVSGQVVSQDALQPRNEWDVYLEAAESTQTCSALPLVDVQCKEAIYAPKPPEWDEESGGVSLQGGLLQLSFLHPDSDSVLVDIYRNGALHATVKDANAWLDLRSGNYPHQRYVYHLVARCRQHGLTSHPTRGQQCQEPWQVQSIPADEMSCVGGHLVDGHFENWGLSSHELVARDVTVCQSGRYAVQVNYANGSGPINTGITCAVKRGEVLSDLNVCCGAGYFIMPQTSDWKRFLLSNRIVASLEAGRRYAIRISEDAYCRNMSYLASNAAYTARAGGGGDRYNFVNIAELRLGYIASL
ncbi:amylo-alpha-1,6-glucosidase [Cerasicoccus frondis]|uniref:amylo-alpha-1,6-glucosidase n=1 Tax=Cerasicoccus frondis TaxID=490090 RepID=UPI002852742D|nr:amylo-alpha-1,6-glucosidase [Cerasicoccus frondis]